MMKNFTSLFTPAGSRFWLGLLAVIGALVVYAYILFLPIPAIIGLFVRYNLVFLTIIALPLMFLVFRVRGAWGTFAALALTLVLFGLPLSGLWRSGASEPFIIGGLLPFSDAASYYSDALRVVEGFRFSAFSARRPLFPALLTVLLAITGQNLMASIAILAGLIAIACYLATREMQRSFGTLPAVVFLFVLFLFYRRISGTTLTENLGLPLGVLALAVLWSAGKNKKIWHVFLGLLILTLALNARAGTFFILPALILWAGFSLKGKRKISFLTLGICTAAVAGGFLINMLVFKLIADPGGMVFSNFSYTLYGVVSGGKGWMQIFIDHPELTNLDDVTRSAQTYSLVFEAWKAHPFNILLGALKNWFDYLMPRGAGAFGFLRGNEAWSWMNYAVRILLSLLAGWGLVVCWKHRTSEPHGMMIWAAVGLFLSVPFVPPNDSNQMRVYAATVAFLIAFCIIGLRSILDLIFHKSHEVVTSEGSSGKPSMVYALTLAVVTVCGALLVKTISISQPFPSAECPAEQTQFLMRITSGSLVQVRGEAQALFPQQLNVSLESFVNFNEGYPEMHAALMTAVGEGAILARPLDIVSMQYPLLTISNDQIIQSTGLMDVCAIPYENEELNRRGWWRVLSINALEVRNE